ncbi:tRNA selenocysteine 1-associated protein 1 [Bombina bombina]|uniref:tRNA selenocysteine 1-associated protein 1 n=1 Tax=Bombina bombina TaxID=8345 RepID=UPI00235A8F6F|nr:tRNA selenocysteine 1-associated protein 1 [Bombina bombina]
MGSLWMGDLTPDMSVSFISDAFAFCGETVKHVRIIYDRVSGLPTGYGFVTFSDQLTALDCMKRLHGQIIPNTSPTKLFNLRPAYAEKVFVSKIIQLKPSDQTQTSNESNQTHLQKADNDNNITEDPMLRLDVQEANKQFMKQSEELYDDLMDCHWLPLDSATSNIP